MKISDFLIEAPVSAPGGNLKRGGSGADSNSIITVKSGDSLPLLSRQYDTTPQGLEWLNPGMDLEQIQPGVRLRVRDDGFRSDQTPDTASGAASGNAKIAMDFFMQQGWSPAQAAGLVANLQAESGKNLNPAAFRDGEQAYGIAQWRGSRQRDFQHVMGRPLKGSSLQDQLKFVQWELNNSEKSAGQRLRTAKSAADAAAIVDQYYERSSGIHRSKRIQMAPNLSPTATA